MSDSVLLGVIAIGLGIVGGVVLFVPFVAIRYRRAGTLTLGATVAWAAALVYFFAIWTYTLLPLPDPDTIQCVGMNLDPGTLVTDVEGAVADADGSIRAFITNRAVLQLALNVLLFVPLGAFVRLLGHRGVLVALGIGLLLSAFIETTQLTGVWGLFPCAYRVFDVVDIMTNTTGAVLGSLLALAVPRRLRRPDPDGAGDLPRPVTRGRRLLAMFCDVLAVTLISITASLAVQVALVYFGQREVAVEGEIGGVVGSVVGIAVASVIVLATGRSLGDIAVELEYVGGPLPRPIARLSRLLGGIGGYAILNVLPAPWSIAALVYLIAAIVTVFVTANARGLPGLVSGQQLIDRRERTVDRLAR